MTKENSINWIEMPLIMYCLFLSVVHMNTILFNLGIVWFCFNIIRLRIIERA